MTPSLTFIRSESSQFYQPSFDLFTCAPRRKPDKWLQQPLLIILWKKWWFPREYCAEPKQASQLFGENNGSRQQDTPFGSSRLSGARRRCRRAAHSPPGFRTCHQQRYSWHISAYPFTANIRFELIYSNSTNDNNATLMEPKQWQKRNIWFDLIYSDSSYRNSNVWENIQQ